MKKIVILLLCLGLLFAGCSSSKEDSNGWKPELVSDDFAPYVERAVEILEDYLESDISAEYASLRLEVLGDEVDALDINLGDIYEKESDYCEADWMLAQSIRLLGIGGIYANNQKQTESLENDIDIFNFHLGKKISGKNYAPDKYISDDSTIAQKIVPNSMPIDSAYSSDSEVTLRFGYLDGVRVEEIGEYVQKIVRNAERDDILLDKVTVVYDCCEQIVFEIIIDLSGSEASGSLYPYVYPFVPTEIEPLATFDSLSDLPDVLQIAQDYFGRD